jgi:SAM-dependent methyltransferase
VRAKRRRRLLATIGVDSIKGAIAMQQLIAYKETMRGTWATGDYDAMLRQEGLYGVGARLVRRLGIRRGERVLDVATGTGNAGIPAAQAGARVSGLDLTPELLEVARRRAVDAGVDVEWVEGDAEALPFADDQFDVVMSTFGAQFVPRHEVVADEMARVLRPGGRMGLVAWTPEGAIGDFFRTVAPHLPAPPDFADPPLSWGDEEHVHELLEGTGITLQLERDTWEITHPDNASAVRCYTTTFGPVVVARELAEADGGWSRLREDLTALFERLDTTPGPAVVFPAEYLVATGTKEG